MNKTFTLCVLALVLCLAVKAVKAGDSLHAKDKHGELTSDFHIIAESVVAQVPAHSDFDLSSSPHHAGYDIVLSFERSCEGQMNPETDGLETFETLYCHYSKDQFEGCFAGASVDADPFFAEGQTVYFASGLELSVELTSGNKVDVELDLSDVLSSADYCDGINAQEQVVQDMTVYLLTRNYNAIIPHLAPDINLQVNVFATEYVGIPVVVAYFLLGDPSISDSFETLGSEKVSVTSDGNIVYGKYLQTIKSLQLPDGVNVYQDNQVWEARFNEYNQIKWLRLSVDTAKVFAYYPQSGAPDITEVCTSIMNSCQGIHQQYADLAACETFMNSIPLLKGLFAQSVGVNDAACRAFHSVLAVASTHHCLHTGPYNGGVTATPCIDETGPFDPIPSPKVANKSIRSMQTASACDAGVICDWSVAGHDDTFLNGNIAFERATINNVPAAGVIIQACADAGEC